jgi:hypothetical protein
MPSHLLSMVENGESPLFSVVEDLPKNGTGWCKLGLGIDHFGKYLWNVDCLCLDQLICVDVKFSQIPVENVIFIES